jgi:hypothetical protein
VRGRRILIAVQTVELRQSSYSRKRQTPFETFKIETWPPGLDAMPPMEERFGSCFARHLFILYSPRDFKFRVRGCQRVPEVVLEAVLLGAATPVLKMN